MELVYSASNRVILMAGREIKAWSKVRNEINGYRPNPDRVKAGNPDTFRITRADGSLGPVSMPKPFPIGEWNITGIVSHPDKNKDGYLYPYYIATDAHQPLEIWETDENGFYVRGTGEFEEDYFYGAHFSTNDWTQGCIRVGDLDAGLLPMVLTLRPKIAMHESIKLISVA